MNHEGLIGRAYERAMFAHAGEVRRVTAVPFILHPVRVATRVWSYGDEVTVAAALLHDVVEMHQTDISDFPPRVQVVVSLLTCRNEGKPGAETKEEHVIRICESGDRSAILVKLADRIDNLTDGAEAFGVKWLRKYLTHSYTLLDGARKKWFENEPLWIELDTIVLTLSQRVSEEKGKAK